jgi:hypothetical protein
MKNYKKEKNNNPEILKYKLLYEKKLYVLCYQGMCDTNP